jgi:hypothetical protein
VRVTLRPELSAQGIRKSPSPMLKKCWATVTHLGLPARTPLVVDYGCGQLRNVRVLLTFSRRLVLVDTETQLSTPHEFYGRRLLPEELIRERWPVAGPTLLTSTEFEARSLGASVIFIINVFDVVPAATRKAMIRAAVRNLLPNGYLVIIAPRNDTWTLRLCTPARKYRDGYAFAHPRGHTYFRNWKDDSLQTCLLKSGIDIVTDLSVYRYVTVIGQPRREHAVRRNASGRRAERPDDRLRSAK